MLVLGNQNIIDGRKYGSSTPGGQAYPLGAKLALALYEIPNYAYTGPLLIVYRTSDNSTQTFYQGATPGTFNTTRGGGGTDMYTWIGAGSGYVFVWYGQDSFTTQSYNYSPSSMPRIVNSGVAVTLNGFPALEYNSASNIWSDLYLVTQTSAVPYVGFTVQQRAAAGKNGLWVTGEGNSNGYGALRFSNNDVILKSSDGNTTSNSASTFAGPEVFSWNDLGTSTQITSNGVDIPVTADHAGFPSAPVNELGRFNAGGLYCDTKVAEVLLYNTDIGLDYMATHNAMKSYYGL